MQNAQQVWEWIGKNLWAIIVFGSLFIQISPIKNNPWSFIIKWVGKLIMNEACGKMDDLITKVNEIEKEQKENEKDRIRWEILAFANSCHSGEKHTKDEFNHIIELNDKYTRLLAATEDTNGVFTAEYGYIYKLYEKLIQKNAFMEIGDDSHD